MHIDGKTKRAENIDKERRRRAVNVIVAEDTDGRSLLDSIGRVRRGRSISMKRDGLGRRSRSLGSRNCSTDSAPRSRPARMRVTGSGMSGKFCAMAAARRSSSSSPRTKPVPASAIGQRGPDVEKGGVTRQSALLVERRGSASPPAAPERRTAIRSRSGHSSAVRP